MAGAQEETMQKYVVVALLASLLAITTSQAEEFPELTIESKLEELLKARPDLIIQALKNSSEEFIDAYNEALTETTALKEKRDAEELDARFASRLTPRIDSHIAMRGSIDAPITIVEYTDFQCPYCASVAPTIKGVMELYPGKIRLFLKHNPLDFHPMSRLSAAYFEAISLQDKEMAWIFHDLVLQNQKLLNRNGEETLKGLSIAIGVDRGSLEADVSSPAVLNRIQMDQDEASSFGLSGTPSFTVNGVVVAGAYPLDHFSKVIDRLLADGDVPHMTSQP
jgi:protein-disulfide isomerase